MPDETPPPDAPPETPPETPAPPEDPAGADAPLGEQGVKALNAFKERARTAEAEVKRLAALEAELDKLRTAQLSEHEQALVAARQEAADEARSSVLSDVNRRLFSAELKAAAAGKVADPDLLSDPEVALRLLGLGEIPVTESGDIDAEAISASLTSLLEAKPYLVASATQPGGNADQGARRTPQPKDLQAQIQEAEAAGDWQLAGQLKLHKLAAAAPRP